MIRNFHASLAALRPGVRNPLIALVVSDEAATYRPEMEWLAHQMQIAGQRVFCMRPEDLFPLGGALFFDVEGNPEKIDIIYRFFELFDLASIKTAPYIFEAWASGEVAIAPPMRPFQEEKLAFALFHHHLLQDYWSEALGAPVAEAPRPLIPPTWVMDPAPLPPGAVLDGPGPGAARSATGATWSRRRRRSGTSSSRSAGSTRPPGGRGASSWAATARARSGSRGRARARARPDEPARAPGLPEAARVRHSLYGRAEPHEAREADGRLRLCPYYFVVDGKARLSGGARDVLPPGQEDHPRDAGRGPAAVRSGRPSAKPRRAQLFGACAWMSARRFSISFSLLTRSCSTFLRSLLVMMLKVRRVLDDVGRQHEQAGDDALVLEGAQVERRQLVVQLDRVAAAAWVSWRLLFSFWLRAISPVRAVPTWSEIRWLYFSIDSRVRFWSLAISSRIGCDLQRPSGRRPCRPAHSASSRPPPGSSAGGCRAGPSSRSPRRARPSARH
jgi:hypothetical protein